MIEEWVYEDFVRESRRDRGSSVSSGDRVGDVNCGGVC